MWIEVLVHSLARAMGRAFKEDTRKFLGRLRGEVVVVVLVLLL